MTFAPLDGPPVAFEEPPVVICQCRIPCHKPVKDEAGQWYGCVLVEKHEGECSLEGGSGELEYNETPSRFGPRIVLRPVDGILSGHCPRCHRDYRVAVTSAAAEHGEHSALAVAGHHPEAADSSD